MSHQCSRVKVALLLLNSSELRVSSSASASRRATKLEDQFRVCVVEPSAQADVNSSSTMPHAITNLFICSEARFLGRKAPISRVFTLRRPYPCSVRHLQVAEAPLDRPIGTSPWSMPLRRSIPQECQRDSERLDRRARSRRAEQRSRRQK